MGQERTEGERRAAEEFADAVRPDTVRFFEAMVNQILHNPEVLRLRPETLTEEEADRVALEAVHRAREESPRESEDRPPSRAEVRAWSEARERDRSEGRTARVWNPTPPR